MSKVHAFVDETGDRGGSSKASPIFGMAAVIAEDSALPGLRTAVNQLRGDFHVPEGEVLSWKAHVKNHDRRRRAAEVLSAVPDVMICYVYARKAELRHGSYRDDPQRFYNYLAYKMFKSAIWAAKHEFGATDVFLRFGHVRHHDHRSTEAYIRREMRRDLNVPHELLRSLRWVSADSYSESQAADLYGGFLKSALWPAGEFGMVEPAYLLQVWHQIRCSSDCVIPLGVLSMPTNDVLKREPWFPCTHCQK